MSVASVIRWTGAFGVAAVAALAVASSGTRQWSFDADGNLPAGWRAAATGGKAATRRIARYNPLERNLRLYYVKQGMRRMLADAPGLAVGSGEWFVLKVAHHGERIEVWLNGKKLIETADRTFAVSGGVGVRTKADAISAFDDFKVNAEN